MNIEINGIRWSVITVPHLSDCLRRSDGSFTVGVTDNSLKTICLSNRLEGVYKRKVLIHEICHAVCMSEGIHIPIEQEEFLCDFVASHGDEIFSIVDRLLSALDIAA